MTDTTDTARQERDYLSEWAGVDADGPSGGPAWIYPLRKQAADRFRLLGLPGRRDEEWRFTPLTALTVTPLRQATRLSAVELAEIDISAYRYPGFEGIELVFINGQFSPVHSTLPALPTGVKATNLAHAFNSDAASIEPHLGRYAEAHTHPFVALNTAALADGAFIEIARGVSLEIPIHLLFVSIGEEPAAVTHPRVLIVAHANSRATIIESYVGPADSVYLTNAVTEIIGEEDSLIDHYKVQRESKEAFHVASTQILPRRGATFSSHSIGLGGRIARNDINAVLAGERIECTLNGLYLASGQQLHDNHTSIDHAMPHCDSHEVYKGILDGHARGVFNGKIFVRQDAQKTDAKQTNKTLLLSDDAQINTKPQLEIYADDVKCTHGATVGQLDADSLFYLRARGIPLAQARALLTYAFASEIVSRVKIEPIRAALDRILLAERGLDMSGMERGTPSVPQ